MTGPVRFLFVDDDDQILRALQRLLQREGFELHFTVEPPRVLAMIEALRIEVLVCDHVMPGTTGVKLLGEVRVAHPRVTRVLASGSQDRSIVGTTEEGHVQHFLDKPWFAEDLRRLMHELARGALALRTDSAASSGASGASGAGAT